MDKLEEVAKIIKFCGKEVIREKLYVNIRPDFLLKGYIIECSKLSNAIGVQNKIFQLCGKRFLIERMGINKKWIFVLDSNVLNTSLISLGVFSFEYIVTSQRLDLLERILKGEISRKEWWKQIIEELYEQNKGGIKNKISFILFRVLEKSNEENITKILKQMKKFQKVITYNTVIKLYKFWELYGFIRSQKLSREVKLDLLRSDWVFFLPFFPFTHYKLKKLENFISKL